MNPQILKKKLTFYRVITPLLAVLSVLMIWWTSELNECNRQLQASLNNECIVNDTLLDFADTEINRVDELETAVTMLIRYGEPRSVTRAINKCPLPKLEKGKR